MPPWPSCQAGWPHLEMAALKVLHQPGSLLVGGVPNDLAVPCRAAIWRHNNLKQRSQNAQGWQTMLKPAALTY